jgi:hypothetical protein
MRDARARGRSGDALPDGGRVRDAVAPHIAGGKAEAAELMQQLFGEEFKRESAM